MKKNLIFWVTLVLLVGIVILVWIQSEQPYKDKTEENFYLYKEDREEIIRMLVSGEIAKEQDRAGNVGFYFYYTPPQYLDAVKSETIRAGMHSKEHFFVFFQSAEQPLMDTRGLTEGFIYSSTGAFPTPKEFDYFSDYKKIDEHWYFVSDDLERFEKSCLSLCEQ